MRNYKQVVDLVQRRLGMSLEGDNIFKIYAEMDDSKPLIYKFILHADIDPHEKTKIEVRYRHAFLDMPCVDVEVLQYTQYFTHGRDCYPIYNNKDGFVRGF